MNPTQQVKTSGTSIEETDYESFLNRIASALDEIDRITTPFQINSPTAEAKEASYAQTAFAARLLSISTKAESLKDKLSYGIFTSKG